jgi:hypothetical protein
MYYPYFFSNKFEMNTIFKLKKKIDSGLLLPIIEMYKIGPDTIKTTSKIASSKTPFILIINPYNQREEKVDQAKIQDIINSLMNFKESKIIFGLYLDKNNLDFCTALINEYTTRKIALFLRDTEDMDINVVSKIAKNNNIKYNFFYGDAIRYEYHAKFKGFGKKIILEDPFKKQVPNSKYKESSDETFYNLHRTYKDLGFEGFGDYLTIGSTPSDARGSLPSTVVIHYTYPDGEYNEHIRIRRFFGDINKECETTSDGVLKAMKEAHYFIANSTSDKCKPCNECNDLIIKTKRGQSYDLGVLKQFSMMHHVNMIVKLINS